jgi:ribose transport system permease protein
MKGLRVAARSVLQAGAAVAAAVILLVLNFAIQPSILSAANLGPLVAVASAFILISMAQAPALLAGGGGVDLSVGPLAGLVAILIVQSGVTDVFLVIGLVVLVGATSGTLMGALIAYVRVPPIIATLGAFLFYSGLALHLQPIPGGRAPAWLSGLSGTVLGVPGMLFPLVGIAICWTALMLTPYRRNLLAVGGDARAAFTSGVKVSLTRLIAYVLSGVLAAFAGLAFVAVLGSADANAAPSYTLVSLAGAALGGVSMSGGRGSMLGAAAGGATMFLIQNLLGLAQVSVFALQVVFGAALIVALALNSYADHRRRTGHLRRARSEVRQQA